MQAGGCGQHVFNWKTKKPILFKREQGPNKLSLIFGLLFGPLVLLYSWRAPWTTTYLMRSHAHGQPGRVSVPISVNLLKNISVNLLKNTNHHHQVR